VSVANPPQSSIAGRAKAISDPVIGVDVGGTKISIGVMRAGVLSEQVLLQTECSDQGALIDQLVKAVKDTAGKTEGETVAVGIGIPSVIEFATGRVRSSVNIPLRDVPLRDVLQEGLGGLPVYVDNDATCAALAEAHDEQGNLDIGDLVMFTVGTGVGGGIIIDGRVYRGVSGGAGELGHMIIAADMDFQAYPPDARFPRPGSLAALASGRALDHLANALATEHPASQLGRAAASGVHITGVQAVSAAQDGDPQAIAALEVIGQRLGIGIANVINIFDPEVVAIGGGVSKAAELLLGPAREIAQRFVLPGVGTSTEIRLARSGSDAGVRGAALLAAQELMREPSNDTADARSSQTR
jgi:glucokinase